MSYSTFPTHTLLNVLSLIMELEQPIPTDIIIELNMRGIIIEEEYLH